MYVGYIYKIIIMLIHILIFTQHSYDHVQYSLRWAHLSLEEPFSQLKIFKNNTNIQFIIEILEKKYKFQMVRCVNDVITHKKLQDPECYHIILYSRHNNLAKKT